MRNVSPPTFASRVIARLLTALGASAAVILLVLSGLSWRADTALYDLLILGIAILGILLVKKLFQKQPDAPAVTE